MTFYALLTAGFFLLVGSSILRATGGIYSVLYFKVIPAILGIWLLWEAALIYLAA